MSHCLTASKFDILKRDILTIHEDEEYIEDVVCQETDINENEMKQFELGGAGNILLIKQNGELSAVGAKCSHFGAPLSTGVLGKGRVRCPLHGACFNIKTGDIEDFPSQDSIPCYSVSVEGGKIKVRAKKSDLKSNKRIKKMAKKNENDPRVFVIVGGGPSGGICVESLRQEGFTGRIILVGKEPHLPYDRTRVSKSMGSAVTEMQYRDQAFYDMHSIETILGVEVVKLDTTQKEVYLSNGYRIKYDKIYIATGSKAKKVVMPGSHLEHVVTLRNYEDAQFIYKHLTKDAHVVILGVSYIGIEAASYCVEKVKKVTVIGRDSLPFKPVFGKEIGQGIMDWFMRKKVEFIMKREMVRCIESDGKLFAVELNDGTVVKADICLMGTGTLLYTEFLEGSGLKINPNGSIDTDLYLETNVPDVYVGGEIANAPVFPLNQQSATIDHYPLSQSHGRIAALNMMSKRTPLKIVPFSWTNVFGKSIRFVGHGNSDKVKIVGNLKDFKFYAFYFDDNDKVVAMSSCQNDPVVAQFAEYLSQGKTLFKNQLQTDPLAWTSDII